MFYCSPIQKYSGRETKNESNLTDILLRALYKECSIQIDRKIVSLFASMLLADD